MKRSEETENQWKQKKRNWHGESKHPAAKSWKTEKLINETMKYQTEAKAAKYGGRKYQSKKKLWS